MGVRLVFATGYEGHLIPPRFAGSPRLVKPIATEHLIEVLADGARRPTPAGC
jgi:hypothetical protein